MKVNESNMKANEIKLPGVFFEFDMFDLQKIANNYMYIFHRGRGVTDAY